MKFFLYMVPLLEIKEIVTFPINQNFSVDIPWMWGLLYETSHYVQYYSGYSFDGGYYPLHMIYAQD